MLPAELMEIVQSVVPGKLLPLLPPVRVIVPDETSVSTEPSASVLANVQLFGAKSPVKLIAVA
jgi:hypothetical protein